MAKKFKIGDIIHIVRINHEVILKIIKIRHKKKSLAIIGYNALILHKFYKDKTIWGSVGAQIGDTLVYNKRYLSRHGKLADEWWEILYS